MGTGIIVVLSRGGISRSDNWKIYGNVFYGGVRTYDNTDAAICVINDQIANNWKIYNNTFINLHGGFNHTGIQFNSSSGGGHEIYNNLWYNCEAVMYNGNYTADYDYFIANTSSPNEAHSQIGGTSDPFVSYPLFDFHLRNATENGRNDLGSPYHIDPDGTMRGSDGIWDRGAYEFGGSPVQYPDPPQSLRIVQ